MSVANSTGMTRETHDKISVIENLVWEIAKIVEPNSYIDPKKVKNASELLLAALK